MKRARILMIAWSDLRFYPPVVNLGTALTYRDADVRLLGFRPRGGVDLRHECQLGFSLFRVADYPDRWPKKITCMARMLLWILRCCVAWKPTVIVAHGGQAVGLALFAKILSGARTAYCAHELNGGRKGSIALRIAAYIEKIAARRFHEVICADDHRAEVLQRQLRLKRKPSVIPNAPLRSGADCDCTVQTALQFARKYSPAAQHIVVYAGRVGSGMALAELCCSIGLLSEEYVLVVAGAVDSDFKSEAEALFASPRVHYAGTIAYSHLRRWLQGASVGFVCYQARDLNTQFAAPSKMYEYLAAGLPVIANEFPLAVSTISANRLGVCLSNTSAAAIAPAISLVCSQSSQLSNECRQFFVSQLSYDSHADSLISSLCTAG